MCDLMEFNLSGVFVQIGIPVHGLFDPRHTICQVETACALKDRGVPFDLKYQYGCSIIQQARSFVADSFLQSECTHLFMIDADIAWKSEDFLRLLALCTKMECVTGIYPVKREPETWMMNAVGSRTVNEYGCLPIDGVGLGFCCIQRKVIQQLSIMAEKLWFADRPHPVAHIFRCDSTNGHFRGEDMAFFADLKEMGHQVWLDPTIDLGHVGAKEYRGSFLDAIRGRKVG